MKLSSMVGQKYLSIYRKAHINIIIPHTHKQENYGELAQELKKWYLDLLKRGL